MNVASSSWREAGAAAPSQPAKTAVTTPTQPIQRGSTFVFSTAQA